MIRRVWLALQPFLHGMRKHFVLLVAAATVGGLAEAAALLTIVRVAVALNSGPDTPIELPVLGELSAGQATGIAAVCAVAALLAHVSVASESARLSSSVHCEARATSVRRFVEAGWPTQALQREGALQETATTLSYEASVLAQSFATGLVQAITVVILVAVAVAVDPLSTSVVVAAGIGIVICMRPLSSAIQRRARRSVALGTRFAEEVSRLTSMAMETRVFGVQRAVEQSIADLLARYRRAQLRLRFATLLGGSMFKDAAILVLVGCVGLLAFLGGDVVAGVSVVIALVVRSLASAQAVNAAYQSISASAAGLDALNQRLSVLEAGVVVAGVETLSQLRAIEFRDVAYRYSDDVLALDGLSFVIGRGDALGIVGPSGGGKSSLVQVLLRLRLPTTGRVLVNGVDYSEFDDTSWTRLLGFVPQEPSLIEASVADNIAYYRDIPRDGVESAARAAHVYDEIARLPQGFDTLLGPRGSGLSGGQKQRVAIARALAGRPQLLVMDEPSSALDVRSERLLQETIAGLKGQTTMVIVAHRMTTVESCDRLLVLERGRIAQLGTPDELLGTDGFFRSIQPAAPVAPRALESP